MENKTNTIFLQSIGKQYQLLKNICEMITVKERRTRLFRLAY